jgi:hypothetical protein
MHYRRLNVLMSIWVASWDDVDHWRVHVRAVSWLCGRYLLELFARSLRPHDKVLVPRWVHSNRHAAVDRQHYNGVERYGRRHVHGRNKIRVPKSRRRRLQKVLIVANV